VELQKHRTRDEIGGTANERAADGKKMMGNLCT
jgi:hypothetical protein